jgi:large subunit ribosomal protein L25
MTDKHTFSVQERTTLGKKVAQLRKQGLGVGSISTPNGKAKSVQFEQKKFSKMLENAGESSLLYLSVGEEKKQRPVLVDEIQENPVTGEMIHVTFRQVSLKDKVVAEVPVEFVGETNVPDTTLVIVRDMVEVEALPTDLPEKIEVDVTTLTEAGQTIAVSDLNVDTEKVTIVIGEDQEAENMPVVMLQEVQEEVADEPEEATEGEESAESEASSEETNTSEPAESAE